MAITHTKLPSVAYAAGLAAIYLGERVVEPGRTGAACTLLGLGAIAVALVLALRQASPAAAPLVVSVDQEGGLVQRLRLGVDCALESGL